MSTDIAVYLEKLTPKGWVHAQDADLVEFGRSGHFYLPWEKRVCIPQSYDLFAVLADVRNYHNIKPISEYHELGDCSEFMRDLLMEECSFRFSRWYFIQDLVAFPWRQRKTTYGGWVTPTIAKQWHEQGLWYEHVDREQGETKTEYIEREVSYYDICPEFVDEVLPKLESIGDPTTTRVILLFD
jgi:hypothetical protein